MIGARAWLWVSVNNTRELTELCGGGILKGINDCIVLIVGLVKGDLIIWRRKESVEKMSCFGVEIAVQDIHL